MRTLCRSGHIAFYPRTHDEILRFIEFYKVDLIRERDYYTFSGLAGAPRYSLPGTPYLNVIATKLFEGDPWDVMSANGLVYNSELGILVLAESITAIIKPDRAQYSYVIPNTLLQAGTLLSTGQRILSYDGEYTAAYHQFWITGFEYE